MQEVVAALDVAFTNSFKSITPTYQRILLGLDVSGSMKGTSCVGSDLLNCIDASAAVALFLARSEPHLQTVAFNDQVQPFPLTADWSLSRLMQAVPTYCGATDLSIPISHALRRKLHVDAFVIITDSEDFYGKCQNKQLLDEYRRTINPQAKLVVLAAAANRGSVADPKDPLSFGVSGFDSAAPRLIMDFIREKS